ncbi:MAG: zinc ribbon domain-containing protein [Acidimicrobiales bacterium]
MTYAYICDACQHEASHHRLIKGGDVKAGPYRCRRCSCEIAQNAPMHGLSEGQYRIYRRSLDSRSAP